MCFWHIVSIQQLLSYLFVLKRAKMKDTHNEKKIFLLYMFFLVLEIAIFILSPFYPISNFKESPFRKK